MTITVEALQEKLNIEMAKEFIDNHPEQLEALIIDLLNACFLEEDKLGDELIVLQNFVLNSLHEEDYAC